jgi:undecaprenyldiphospho-muramoylpentapeptide beta-N-acetylglucosaminyltransferase
MAVIAVAGGGTGGHVYPALAIADELGRRGHSVVYYGDAGRLEGRVVPERGLPFRPVTAPQYPRGGLVGRARFAWGLLRAVLAARSRLRADGVAAVLGVGGYISAPAVLAAWTLGVHRAVHEANVVPGMANRLCARVAQVVLLTYAQTRARLPGGAPKHVVGVPVDARLLLGDRAEAAARYGLDAAQPTVLFVGGSLGAARINELALAVMRMPGRSFQVLHLTGPKYIEQVRTALGEAPAGVSARGYEDRMALAYAIADLVVCRAGSSTLAELCAVGRASLLVPSPHVTENHQEENAFGLASSGAAEVRTEASWDEAAVAAQVARLMGDEPARRVMATAARALARLDAASAAADRVEELLGVKR